MWTLKSDGACHGPEAALLNTGPQQSSMLSADGSDLPSCSPTLPAKALSFTICLYTGPRYVSYWTLLKSKQTKLTLNRISFNKAIVSSKSPRGSPQTPRRMEGDTQLSHQHHFFGSWVFLQDPRKHCSLTGP